MNLNVIYYLAIAIVVGWIATDFLNIRGSLFFTVILSMLGALFAGSFVAPRLGVPGLGAVFNYRTLLLTLGGEILFILIFNFPKLFRRRD